MSKSVRTVPWNRNTPSSMVPPVPEILRPPTSMSLRGRNCASTPKRRRPSTAASQIRAVSWVMFRPPKSFFRAMISQPIWLGSKKMAPPPVSRRLMSTP